MTSPHEEKPGNDGRIGANGYAQVRSVQGQSRRAFNFNEISRVGGLPLAHWSLDGLD